MSRRILALNRVRFGPFASGHGHKISVVLPLVRFGGMCPEEADAYCPPKPCTTMIFCGHMGHMALSHHMGHMALTHSHSQWICWHMDADRSKQFIYLIFT
jgi:hypothetical protein